MSMLNDADKPSLEELMHFGVKGMRWGHRSAKVTTADIKSARIRTRSREANLNRTADRLNTATSQKEKVALAKDFGKQQMEFLKNPDRATAMRLTTGEKFVLAALGPVGVGAAIGQVGARKFTEVSVRKANR